MTLPARLVRLSATAVFALTGLTAVSPPSNASGSGGSDVVNNVSTHTSLHSTSDTVNGVTTETDTSTVTIHVTSSDGHESSLTDTHESSSDGSSHDHSQHDYTNPDGSTMSVTTDDTSDPNGRSRTETTTTVDADGNRTTTTTWEAFDGEGKSTGRGKNTQRDKVTPPTPRAQTAAPTSTRAEGSATPTHSGTATPASTAAEASTAPEIDPETWVGTITYSFVGEASGGDVGTITDTGSYKDSAIYDVVLSRDTAASSTPSWTASGGTATASVDDDLYQTDQGTSQRSTVKGSDWERVPAASCILAYSGDRTTYSIECHPIRFHNMEYILYEPGGGGIYDGPMSVIWYADHFVIKNQPLPSHPASLSGSQRVDVRVDAAGPVSLPVQADVSWKLTGAGAAPTTPPDVTGSVDVNGPPLAVSLPQRSQRAVVGLPLLPGQKPTLNITGNTIGAVKISLVNSGGEVIATTASNSASFSLVAENVTTSGTYSIVIEPGPGRTGELSVAATSP